MALLTYRNLGYKGRLGNQLFQMASTIGLAQQGGDDVIFPAGWKYRPFFSVPDELFGDIPECAVESFERATMLDPRVRHYLQDIQYFWDSLALIRSYFRPGPAAQFTKLNGSWVGIHVRRGDNAYDPGVPNKADYHLCPTQAYYQQALKELRVQEPVFIASDDVVWCQQHLHADLYGDGLAMPKEHEPLYESTQPQDWRDLFTLSQCQYFVLSGSTFGTWAALLADVPPENVIRPAKVYGPLLSHVDENRMFHSSWQAFSAT